MTSPVIKRRKRPERGCLRDYHSGPSEHAPDQDKATRISFEKRCGSFLSDSAVESILRGVMASAGIWLNASPTEKR